MRSYGQYCPSAAASEVLAERSDVPDHPGTQMFGADTFTALEQGVPQMSRWLLVTLRELERAEVLRACTPKAGGGHRYQLTEAGRTWLR